MAESLIIVDEKVPSKLKERLREKIKEKKDIWGLLNELVKIVLEEAEMKDVEDIVIIFDDSLEKIKLRFIKSFAFEGLEVWGPVRRGTEFPVYPSFIIGRGVGSSKKGREIRCLPKNSKEKIEGIYRILYRIAEY